MSRGSHSIPGRTDLYLESHAAVRAAELEGDPATARSRYDDLVESSDGAGGGRKRLVHTRESLARAGERRGEGRSPADQ